jgi:hypothetical protein
MNHYECTFEGFTFVCTCIACPEQYDVYLENEQNDEENIKAYVRLRFGTLRVECPDVGGKTVYLKAFDEDYKGEFENDEERLLYLQEIAKAIKEHYDAEC